jgi:hypothetical protein
MTDRTALLTEAAELARELLDRVRTTDTIDWRPTRHGLNLPPDRKLPTPHTRRLTTTAPGLLTQLATVHHTTPDPHTTRKHTPTSTPPPGTAPLETLDEITHDITRHRQALPVPTTRPHNRPQTPRTAIRELLGLLPTLDDHNAHQTLQALRHWHHTARLALGLDTPTIPLRNITCPTCHHTGTLRIRADATTDIWCTGTHNNHPCPTTWPRHTWAELLNKASW